MGEQVIDPLIKKHKEKARINAVVMTILGLFAPVMTYFYLMPGFSHINILSLTWNYSSASSYPVSPMSGFQIMPLYLIMSMFPFLLLRFVPVFQIHRYYSGKTTRKRALLASFVGDGYFLFIALPAIIMPFIIGFSMVMLPLPFQVIYAIIMLWRFPLPEPTKPWESLEQSESWWKKSSDSQQEKSSNNDGALW